jgi:hypothetical protein
MNNKEYDKAVQVIHDNMDDIKTHAMSIVWDEHLWTTVNKLWNNYHDEEGNPYDTSQVFEELDEWNAWGECADLNFVSERLSCIKCYAYPVVNGVPNYSKEYEIEILNGTEEPF